MDFGFCTTKSPIFREHMLMKAQRNQQRLRLHFLFSSKKISRTSSAAHRTTDYCSQLEYPSSHSLWAIPRPTIQAACTITSAFARSEEAHIGPELSFSNSITLLTATGVPQRGLNLRDMMNASVGLRWLAQAPRWQSDFKVYMDEPHKQFEQECQAHFHLNQSLLTKVGGLTIVFSHKSSLQVFTKARLDLHLNSGRVASSTQAWTCQSELVLSFIAALQVVVIESTDFLNGLNATLGQMAGQTPIQWHKE